MDRQTKKKKNKKMPSPSQRKQPLSIQAHLPGWTTQKTPTNQNNTPWLEQLVDHCCSGKSIYALGTFTSKGAQVSVPPPAHLIPTHKTHL